MTEAEKTLRKGSRRADAVGWLAAALALALCAMAIGVASDALQARAGGGASDAATANHASAPAAKAKGAVAASAVEPGASGFGPPAPAPADPPPAHVVIEGKLSRGETLARALARQGVDASVAHVVDRAMAPVFNFRYARPGDRFVLTQDEAGQVVAFDYTRSPLERYSLRRGEEGLVPERYEPEILRRRARIAGVVSSSLYEAVADLGEDPELAGDFADIFAWDVDFARGVQSGDEFAILYERRYLADEEGDTDRYLGPGRILAARYSSAETDFAAIYFEPDEGRSGYYRPDGSSVQRQFLKAPLSYRRISSGFAPNRLHPILKVRRPHLGVDYAAAAGTPVWAVADGKVVHVGRDGGLGKTVKVRHRNGYTSYYGHLSRYARGLRVGQQVHQKQVVGYVGSTGLATGPHLHFTLKQHGRYVNPARIDSPAAEPLPEDRLPEFALVRDARLAELEPSSLRVVTNEAL